MMFARILIKYRAFYGKTSHNYNNRKKKNANDNDGEKERKRCCVKW